MICFEFSINGEKRVRAGAGEKGSIHAIANWVVRDIEALRKKYPDVEDFEEEEMQISVVGSDGETSEFLHWCNEELKINDEILIRVIDAQNPDPPVHRQPGACVKPSEEERRKMYEDLKKEFEPEAQ